MEEIEVENEHGRDSRSLCDVPLRARYGERRDQREKHQAVPCADARRVPQGESNFYIDEDEA
jgi:hypothetical protein